MRAHFAAENAHDADGILATFAPGGVMLYNGQAFPDPVSIRAGHAYIGMTAAPGAFAGLRAEVDAEHFTDAEVVIEGRLTGKHTAEFGGFPPTGRGVELPFVSFYRFDSEGKLVSERVVMNLGPLRE